MSDRKFTKSSPFAVRSACLMLWAASKLPLRFAQATGATLGRLAWWVPNRLRLATRVNLALCMPELSDKERRRLARRSLIETGKAAFELGALWGWPPERLAALEESVEGEDLLDAAMSKGRGVIVLAPHIGNWEVLNQFLMRRHPFVALYRKPRLEELDVVIRCARERTGCRMAPADVSGLREIYRTLSRGELTFILPDQEPLKKSGIFAPFFGIDALTMTLVGRLVNYFGADVLLATAERTPRGKFHVRIVRGPEGLEDDDERVAATRLNRAVEASVRACPEQYMWSYKRYRTRPPGSPDPYARK